MVRSSLQEWALCRYWALSKCQFGDTVDEATWRAFLHHLLPWEDTACSRPDGHWAGLGPKVPLPSGPHQCHAHLGKAAHCLHPEEEAWLDVHLDELVAKEVIGPILPGE